MVKDSGVDEFDAWIKMNEAGRKGLMKELMTH